MTSINIHPTALVDPKAKIGSGSQIGPYSLIGPDVQLGENCQIHSHVVIDGHTTIGPRCEFFPFACVGLKTQDLKFEGGKCYLDIGADNVFREHVTVHTATSNGDSTRIGSHNHILAYSHIAHDSIVGNHVIFSNNGTLAGHVVVEDYAIIGGLAAIHQFCRIGTMAIIGGCAKVVQDVPPYMIVDGNPAKTKGINKIGLTRNGISQDTQRVLRDAFKILFRSELTTTKALDKLASEFPRSQELEHFIDFCRESKRGIAR